MTLSLPHLSRRRGRTVKGLLGRTEVSDCYISLVIMPPLTDNRSHTTGVGLRGPFDNYRTEDDEINRLYGFLQRTGLGDYQRVFRIGAFLARQNPGADQVEYVRAFRRQEQAAASNSRLEDTAQHGPIEPIESRRLREQEEDRILRREEHKEKWFRLHVLFRQNWHVVALVGCCSLGAMI